ncbi:MAG: hypothetical protein M3P18_07645, partial [Actinomycetota bacterium]|nr:hypothetical protein [Actinomycetota bacterium]
MRTLTAGSHAIRRAPLALAPLTIEGAAAGMLLLRGVFPATGASAPALAVFPLDVYFDLKQALAHASTWSWLAAVVVASVIIRASALSTTLWLAEGAPAGFLASWMRALRLAAIGVATLLPAALFMFVGVGMRYAPFIWTGAVLGVPPALLLSKRAVRLDVGGASGARGVPRAAGFLAYAYAIGLLASAMTALDRIGVWPVAVVLAVTGPLHAMVLLGWREHARAGTVPQGTSWAVLATALAVAILFGTAGYDRFVRGDPPAPAPDARGSLLVLGGVNSTSTTGALSELDPRQVGFRRSQMRILSYRAGYTYGELATHRALGRVASVVARQIAGARRPRDLLGHSQAALILDRVLKDHLAAPDRAVLLAAPPPYPPPVSVPPPGRAGPGAPAGDMARPLSRLFGLFGANGFDIDAPAAPLHLGRVVV